MTIVTITRIERIAPCRKCGETFPRDNLLGINVSGFGPSSPDPEKVRIRICETCYGTLMDELRSIQWDNSLMRESRR